MPGPKFKEESYKQFVEKLKNQFSVNTLFQGETNEEKAARACFMKYNAGGIKFLRDENDPKLAELEEARTERLEANPFTIDPYDLTKMLNALELTDPKQEELRDEIAEMIDSISFGISGLSELAEDEVKNSEKKEGVWNLAMERVRANQNIIEKLYDLDEMTEFKLSEVPEMQALKTVFRGIKTMSYEITEQTMLDQMEEVDAYIAKGDDEARQADAQLRDSIRENMANNIDASRLDKEMTRNEAICKRQKEILTVSKNVMTTLNEYAESDKQKADREKQDKIAEAEYMISLLEAKLADREQHIVEDHLQYHKERLENIPKQVNGHLPLEYQNTSLNKNGETLDEMGHLVDRDSYEDAVEKLKRDIQQIRSADQKKKVFQERMKRLKEEYSAPEDVEEGRNLYGEFKKAIEHQETAKKLKEMDILKPGFVLNEENAQKAVDTFMELCPNELPGCDEGIVYDKYERDRALEEYRDRRPEDIQELIAKQLNKYENELPGLKEKFPRKFEMVTLLPQDIQKSIERKESELAESRKKTADAVENAKKKANEIKTRYANSGRSFDLSAVMKKAKSVGEYGIEEEIKAQKQLIDSLTKEINGPDTSSPYKKVYDQMSELETETGKILNEAQAAGDKYKAACEGYRAAKGSYDQAAAAREKAQKAQKYANDNPMTDKYMTEAYNLAKRLGKNKSFFHVNSEEFGAMSNTLKEFARDPSDEKLAAVADAAQHYLKEKAKGNHPFTSSMRSYRLNLARDILDFANANKGRVDLASQRNWDISTNYGKMVDMSLKLPLSKNSNELVEGLIKAGEKNGSFKEINELGEVNNAAAKRADVVAQKCKDFKTGFAKEYGSGNESKEISPQAVEFVRKIL